MTAPQPGDTWHRDRDRITVDEVTADRVTYTVSGPTLARTSSAFTLGGWQHSGPSTWPGWTLEAPCPAP